MPRERRTRSGLRRALVAVLATGAFLATAPAGVAAVSFTDPNGDARSAPDITTIVVSNDDAGWIRIRVNIGNEELLRSDTEIYVYLDTDGNAATGAPETRGADYMLVADGRPPPRYWFYRWSDTEGLVGITSSSSTKVGYWSGISVWVKRAEIGGVGSLRFWVRTVRRGRTLTADAAPQAGTFAYTLQPGTSNPPDIKRMLPRQRPGAPRAGRPWTITVPRIELDGSRTLVRPGTVRCRATLAGRALRGSGRGGCRFAPARRMRGQTLVLTVFVTYRGTVVSQTRSYRVR